MVFIEAVLYDGFAAWDQGKNYPVLQITFSGAIPLQKHLYFD